MGFQMKKKDMWTFEIGLLYEITVGYTTKVSDGADKGVVKFTNIIFKCAAK